jgi:hypothetical protein
MIFSRYARVFPGAQVNLRPGWTRLMGEIIPGKKISGISSHFMLEK